MRGNEERKQQQLLVVGEVLPVLPAGWQLQQLRIAFSAAVAEDSCVGRREAQGAAGLVLDIHPRWQGFAADFGQQVGNRLFTDELLDLQPQAVAVTTLSGASMDMVRVAALLGYPVLLCLSAQALPSADSRAWLWLEDALRLATVLVSSGDRQADRRFAGGGAEGERKLLPTLAAGLAALLAECEARGRLADGPEADIAAPPAPASAYGAYAFGMRDHGLLYRMQQPLVAHFAGCRQVLELACGTGVFLELLRQQGIAACGVERDAASARYAQGLGLAVTEADALDYLRRERGRFDGIYCSHFVEHLPIAALEALIRLIADSLQPGGVAVFVFPDPESIRSQLLGFWRDPEHVRFYHPDLVELICRGAGLQAHYHSHRAQPHAVGSFAALPPLHEEVADEELALAELEAFSMPPPGRLERLLGCLGLVHPRALRRLEHGLHLQRLREQQWRRRQQARLSALEEAVRSLWAVNQTWAWEDNAVLCVRKPH